MELLVFLTFQQLCKSPSWARSSNNTTGTEDVFRGIQSGLKTSFIQADGTASFANVGIGVTQPDEILHVASGSPNNIRLANRTFLGSTYAQAGTVLGYMAKADTTNSVLDQIVQSGTGGD